MKCEDVGMTLVRWETGMDDNRNRRYGQEHYLYESWMTWHEGMLSVGYENRRLTGKLNLTGTTWIRGWTESWHVDLRSLIMMRRLGVENKKMSQDAWDILLYFITEGYSSSNSFEYFCHINLSLLFILFSSMRYVM